MKLWYLRIAYIIGNCRGASILASGALPLMTQMKIPQFRTWSHCLQDYTSMEPHSIEHLFIDILNTVTTYKGKRRILKAETAENATGCCVWVCSHCNRCVFSYCNKVDRCANQSTGANVPRWLHFSVLWTSWIKPRRESLNRDDPDMSTKATAQWSKRQDHLYSEVLF